MVPWGLFDPSNINLAITLKIVSKKCDEHQEYLDTSLCDKYMA